MFSENKKAITIRYIAALALILSGVVAGSLYYIYNFIGSADVKNYLDGYINSLKNGMDFIVIIKMSLKSNTILLISIFFASFFRYGFLVSAFFLVREGFISAFTTSAMIDVYNISGLLLSGSSFAEVLVFIPVLALFCATTVFVSENRRIFEKRDKIIYIIFMFVIFTIFCGCAVLDGILTTTFMKWVAFKVT